jgi:hypothetical protein
MRVRSALTVIVIEVEIDKGRTRIAITPFKSPLTKTPIELFSNIFSAERLKRIFFRNRIAFFPPYTGRLIMTVRHYERHKVHQVRFA